MRHLHARPAALVILGCTLIAMSGPTRAWAADPGQDAKRLIQELVATPRVRALKDQKLMLPDLAVSDETDKALVALAKDIRASLQTALINSGFFSVVERSQLDRILKELKLGLSDLSDPEQAQRVGKLANSDLIMLGEVTKVNERVRVSLRLVSIDTGVAVRAVEAVITDAGADESSQLAPRSAAEGAGVINKPPGASAPEPGLRSTLVKTAPSGAAKRGYLGLSMAGLKPEMIDSLKVTQGVVVAEVFEGSPAEQAGLQRYDVIQKVNGKTLESAQELTEQVRSSAAGERLSFSLIRAGSPLELTVTLGEPPVESVLALTGHEGSVSSVAFSADSKTVASASSDNTVRLWDVRTGRLQRSLDEHTDSVNSVAFAPTSELLVTGSEDKTAILWDTKTGTVKQTLSIGAAVNGVAFSPDGQTIASASSDDMVRIWQPESGVLQQSMKHGFFRVISVVFSPRGNLMASASLNNFAGGELKLWDPRTGKLEQSLVDGGGWVTSIAFSPDGDTLAAGFADHQMNIAVKLWSARTGQLKRTLTGFTKQVDALAFSPDGKTLASTSGGVLDLWNTKTGRKRLAFSHNQEHVNSLAFSPDGRVLASAGDDKTVKLWLLR